MAEDKTALSLTRQWFCLHMVGADRDEIHRKAPLEEAKQPLTAGQLPLKWTIPDIFWTSA